MYHVSWETKQWNVLNSCEDLIKRCFFVADGGQTLSQHRVNVSCLMHGWVLHYVREVMREVFRKSYCIGSVFFCIMLKLSRVDDYQITQNRRSLLHDMFFKSRWIAPHSHRHVIIYHVSRHASRHTWIESRQLKQYKT